MKRSLALSSAISVQQFSDGSRAISLPVNREVLEPLLLELMLILHGLAGHLSLRGQGGPRLVVRKSEADFGAALVTSDERRCDLSHRELEAVLAFLLQYFRDGAAPVSHLDLDLTDLTIGPEATITLVVQAQDSQPKMTGDEAKRLLGLDE